VHFLRRISSKQLALLCAAVLAVAGGGTALALAASSGGPVPPRKPLANAVHDAITAPQLQGVTARVSFTNALLSGVDLRGSNPILGGADGRLWATNDGHLRLELQATGGGGDAQIVSDGKSWWIYDGSSHTVYRGTIPQDQGAGNKAGKQESPPTVSKIQQEIDKVMQHASVSGPQPGTTAGEPSYTVRTSPKRDGGLLGALAFAWDANNGAPLRAAVYARGASSPVLELKATDITFGPVDSGVFNVSPPAGAKAQSVTPPNDGTDKGGKKHGKPTTGLAAVQKKVSFKLAAPGTLAGKPRATVAAIGKGDGALVTYGQGLSGIAVVEKSVKAGAQQSNPLGRTELPTVTINGTSAQELTTPLGTVLRFQRGGVMYVVAGSAPRAAVEAAARGL
jgi:outer membrane lipoprotein-sorting protein